MTITSSAAARRGGGGWPGPRCPVCGCSCSAPGPEAKWYTLHAFAERHGISRSTVWRWVDKGLVDAQRLDGHLRVRRRETRSPWAHLA